MHEAVRISPHGGLNSKAEYRQNQIKRLSVQFTDRELKAVERELAKDDHETEAALKSLSLKLQNKLVNDNLVLNCSADQVALGPCKESLKRSRDQDCPLPAKRARVFQDSKMGRKSNGNSANESKNLFKRFKDWQSDGWWSQEILRSQNWPSSFGEASLLARNAYAKRDASNLVPATVVNDVSLRNLSSCSSSISTVSCPDSQVDLSQCTLSPMNALEAPEEAAISVSVLQLTVTDQLEPTTQDSFSSQPDSTFNKGAILFLELLEKALEDTKTKAEALRFEDLVIQMLDLSMDKKLSTPDAITDMLNDQGWNAAQVARVWQVSTTADDGPSWSHEKLTMLGGKDVAKDVWITRRAGS